MSNEGDRFKKMVESSLDWFWEFDENANFVYVSPAVKNLLGYEPDEIIGTNAFDLMDEAEAKRVRSHFDPIAKKYLPFTHLENVNIHKDGHKVVIESSGTPIFDDAGKFCGYRGIDRDMTQRKEAEKQLLETEGKYRALFENMSAGFVLFEVILNDQGDPVDLLILAVNKGFETTTGLKARDVTGKLLTHVLPDIENDAADWVKTYGKIALGGEPCQFEQNSELLGSYYSVLAYQAAPKQCAVTFVDISERKKTEQERERLLLAIEQSAETIMITDPDGYIEYVNPAFEKVTGYSRTEVLGKTPEFLRSNEQGDDYYQQMWQDLNAGKTWRGRFSNKRKDGSSYIEDACISPVCDSAGKITSFIATKHDITEQLVVEEQLLQAQKMESVGQLAGGVAHDFNNLLSLIIGRAELGMRKLDPEDTIYQALYEIQNTANRSAKLTEQLLAFARKQAIAPRVLDLNSSMESTLQMLQRLIGENIDLMWLPGHSLWPIKIDPAQLDQILTNLILNARDAIADVGKVTIESATKHFDQAYCDRHPGFKPGDFSVLSISDDGAGMDEQTLQRIFDPFYTTKGLGRGTGLGLSTVYGIVKQNNAFINVYSEPGQGTTFSLYFPRVIESVTTGPEKPAAIKAGRGQSILLVEDDAELLKLEEELLTELGYQVMASESPETAIEIATSGKTPIDLLITDVVMPGMNGKELAGALLAQLPELKVLFTSGYTANVIAHHSVLDEGVNFLQKPLSMQSLASKLSEILS